MALLALQATCSTSALLCPPHLTMYLAVIGPGISFKLWKWTFRQPVSVLLSCLSQIQCSALSVFHWSGITAHATPVRESCCVSARIVGRPVAVAQRLATRGGAGSVRVAPETWELLRCCDAGTSIKPSSWRPSFKLLMGTSDILDCYSYEPVPFPSCST